MGKVTLVDYKNLGLLPSEQPLSVQVIRETLWTTFHKVIIVSVIVIFPYFKQNFWRRCISTFSIGNKVVLGSCCTSAYFSHSILPFTWVIKFEPGSKHLGCRFDVCHLLKFYVTSVQTILTVTQLGHAVITVTHCPIVAYHNAFHSFDQTSLNITCDWWKQLLVFHYPSNILIIHS